MYALVLGGGGAKGAYQIGVWRALIELEKEVSFVCGTSVGALNGAFVAQKQYDIAYKMWSEIDMPSVFNAEEEVFKGIEKIAQEGLGPIDKDRIEGAISSTLNFIQKTYQSIWNNKGLDVTPLREMIAKYLDEDIIRSSSIGFGLITISINDRKVLRLTLDDIERGELRYYLLGSAMVPGFNQDENFDKKFIDGGVYENFPIKLAYEQGYRDIIGVSLFQTKFKGYKDANVTFISPSKNLGNFLYFNKDWSQRNMQLGYLDAMKAFGEVEGENYYLKNLPTESECLQYIARLTEEQKQEISQLVLKKDYENDKVFFEKVLYRLAKDFGLSSKCSYRDLYIRLFEVTLKNKKVDEYEIYDFKNKARQIVQKSGTKLIKVATIMINAIN